MPFEDRARSVATSGRPHCVQKAASAALARAQWGQIIARSSTSPLLSPRLDRRDARRGPWTIRI